MSRATDLLRTYGFVMLGLTLAIVGVIDCTVGNRLEPLSVSIPFTLVTGLAMLAYRRAPLVAPLVSLLAFVAWSLIDAGSAEDASVPFVAVFITAWAIGAFNERNAAIAGLAILIALVAIVSRQFSDGFGSEFWSDAVWTSFVFTAAWIGGRFLNQRSERTKALEERARRLELEQAEQARLAVAAERARIARELHDIVGHSVSVMTLQAAGVRRLLHEGQQQERDALLLVEQTGREALAEMRRLVGVLRNPEEVPALAPQPSLEHLGRLARQSRESGLPVEVHIEGVVRPLPAGLDLTAYRIVQEGLTNTIKHAGATRADVHVRYRDRDLELIVRDDGTGTGNGAGGGNGLVGMRERVAVYGGTLKAGRRPGGGFELRAVLPVEHR